LPRGLGAVVSCDCVTALFCQAGARPLGACSPPLAAHRDSGGHDPAVWPGAGPLGVRKGRRHRHPTPDPHAGDPVASGEMAAPPAGRIYSAHPKRQERREGHLGGGHSIRRCRGWQIAPEPAGTGRASRAGETAALFHANAEGPRRGSRSPVAGGGTCGAAAGETQGRTQATAAPANKASRSERRNQLMARGAKQKPSRSDTKKSGPRTRGAIN